MAVDADGNTYLAGSVTSPDLPTTAGAWQGAKKDFGMFRRGESPSLAVFMSGFGSRFRFIGSSQNRRSIRGISYKDRFGGWHCIMDRYGSSKKKQKPASGTEVSRNST